MNKEIECKTHPNAPHGFVRNASHTEDRYVCDCEYWEEPKVNERIRLLALEAGYTKDMFGVGHWDMPECKKFAELIIQEAGEAFWSEACHVSDLAYEEYYRNSKKVKRHFGIE